ncbi:type I pullulanase [Marinilactibacillus piezotolerans]|uniref:type I pullulanase n=1 Tax=Marinilactibacillus piezotolerans TaxID=258723 RepID=UPI0009B039D4|nr:type I pullulanase [Marinilactibacillus piezotolerans]
MNNDNDGGTHLDKVFDSIQQKIDYLEQHIYEDYDLGLTYAKQKSLFKVWSPLAEKAVLNLYKTGDENEETLIEQIEMTRQEAVWQVEVERDLAGLFYTYTFTHNGKETETPDIYSKAVGVNGNRSAVVDLRETNPVGWNYDAPVRQTAITEAIIWETHIEDFSSDDKAGFTDEYRGKYLAFTESETVLAEDPEQPTGLNYLKQLGINYVHLLPAFDFENDELGDQYNWGYDPKNYMVPEGKYALNPSDPISRIREFKQMVQSLHQQQIGVVLDVVYNHTFTVDDGCFQRTVPDYYYRQNEDGYLTNGSGCGNETASERKMMRKYMIDSLIYWAQEYHIDGFRFDLMGLHDVDTMNAIRQAFNDAGMEDVILYGEPWNAGSVELHEPNIPADKFHVQSLADGIAIFNDEFRDSIKGPVFDAQKGAFLQGANGYKDSAFMNGDLIGSLLANTQVEVGDFSLPDGKDWARTPSQVVNYASAHDNLPLYDKLVASIRHDNKYSRREDVIQLNKLNAALLFTAQGGIFLQAGEEFGRTKFGDDNSYHSPIDVNKLHWTRAAGNKDLVDYYKGMIEIRKAYPPLRDATTKTAEQTHFTALKENVIAYTIPNLIEDQPKWKQLAVIVNTSMHPESIVLNSAHPLPEAWTIIANRHTAGLESLGVHVGQKLLINPREVLILAAEE